VDPPADPDSARLVDPAAGPLAQAPPGHPHGRPAHCPPRAPVRTGM